MNGSARAIKVPFPQAALAVVAVGIGITALTRMTGDEGQAETLVPMAQEFAVRNERIGISPSDRGPMHLPLIEFELDAPKGKVGDLKAWVEGTDGERLDLATIEKDSPHTRGFGRLGYRRPVKSPRLVVQNDGKNVIEKPLGTLPTPMRAIPLVVPIEPSLRLRRPTKAEAQALAKEYPEESFYLLDSKGDRPWVLPTHILRTEWGAQAALGFRLPGRPKMPPAFSISDTDAGGLAEIDIPHFFDQKFVREATLDIEIVDGDGSPAIRVLRPMTVQFPDGASYEVRPSEKPSSKGTGPDAERSFGLTMRDVNGYPALLTPQRKVFEIGPMPPVRRKGTNHPDFDGRKEFNLELVSPSPGKLGMRRLRVGMFEFASKDKTLPPLAYGRHQLRFRFSRSNITVIDQRLFVAIEP